MARLEPYERGNQNNTGEYDEYNNLWVRDEGYGGPAFGQAIVGLFQIISGIIQWLSELGTRNSRAK